MICGVHCVVLVLLFLLNLVRACLRTAAMLAYSAGQSMLYAGNSGVGKTTLAQELGNTLGYTVRRVSVLATATVKILSPLISQLYVGVHTRFDHI